MTREANRRGLIISAGVVRHTGPVGQLMRVTRWPMVSEATIWLVCRELMAHVPRMTLFWLEREDRVAATAQLVAWVRETHPAVWRTVVAYQLNGDAEVALRSSGAQLYLPTEGRIRSLVERAVLPLVRDGPPREPRGAKALRAGPRSRAGPASRGRLQRDLHPP